MSQEPVLHEIRLYDTDGTKFFANVDLDKFVASVQRVAAEIRNVSRESCAMNYLISQALSDATGNRDYIGREITYATMELAPRTPYEDQFPK